jgi:hypothetical protein
LPINRPQFSQFSVAWGIFDGPKPGGNKPPKCAVAEFRKQAKTEAAYLAGIEGQSLAIKLAINRVSSEVKQRENGSKFFAFV